MADTDPLVEYMIKLNEDPQLLEQHNADPAAAARTFGLSDDDIQLIVSEDSEAIEKRLQAYESPRPFMLITFHSP